MYYTATAGRPCQLYQFSELVPYRHAWAWQRQFVSDRCQNTLLPDVLMILEHPPIYTLGQGASLEFIKFSPGAADLLRVERGGEVTYHGPGQVVVYPILNLTFHQPDLHWYLRQLEEVIIQVLAGYDLQATRIPGLTGVWIGNWKVAAIGIKAKRWITMHGFSLNVAVNLADFAQIVPCGISDRAVGNLCQFRPDLDGTIVRRDLLRVFAQVFGVKYQVMPLETLIGHETLPP